MQVPLLRQVNMKKYTINPEGQSQALAMTFYKGGDTTA